MRVAPGSRDDGRSSAAGDSSPPEPGMRNASGPRKDGHMVETVDSTCSLRREPGMRIVPPPRENCRSPTAVISSPPGSDMRSAPGPREDSHMVETASFTFSLPREPGTRVAPGPREDGRSSEAVSSHPPKPGMRTDPGPIEGGRVVAAAASPPRESGV